MRAFMWDKTTLRNQYRQQRNALSAEARAAAAEIFTRKLLTHPLIKSAGSIGAYLAIHNELDLAPSLNVLKNQAKRILVPVLHPWHATFCFAPWGNTVGTKNKFGIAEPQHRLADLYAPWELDLVLVPLLAADRHGHRLGMGKGYYDRSFAFKNKDQQAKPYLIGCAYEFQLLDFDLVYEETDVLLDELITA